MLLSLNDDQYEHLLSLNDHQYEHLLSLNDHQYEYLFVRRSLLGIVFPRVRRRRGERPDRKLMLGELGGRSRRSKGLLSRFCDWLPLESLMCFNQNRRHSLRTNLTGYATNSKFILIVDPIYNNNDFYRNCIRFLLLYVLRDREDLAEQLLLLLLLH